MAGVLTDSADRAARVVRVQHQACKRQPCERRACGGGRDSGLGGTRREGRRDQEGGDGRDQEGEAAAGTEQHTSDCHRVAAAAALRSWLERTMVPRRTKVLRAFDGVTGRARPPAVSRPAAGGVELGRQVCEAWEHGAGGRHGIQRSTKT